MELPYFAQVTALLLGVHIYSSFLLLRANSAAAVILPTYPFVPVPQGGIAEQKYVLVGITS